MDEFGVLTEKYGLKPQGKSAPMAAAKRITNNISTTKYGSNSNSGFGSVNSGAGFQNQTHSINASSSSFDLDSIFIGSSSSNLKSSSFSSPNYVDDDVFGVMGGGVSVSSSMSSKHSASVDDLLGGFGGGGLESKWKSWNGDGKKNGSDGFDDLLSGFRNGGSGSGGGLYNGSKVQTSRPQQSNGYSYKPTSTISADPFDILESASTRTSKKFSDPLEEFSTINNTHSSTNFTKPGGLRPPPKPSQVVNSNKVKSSGASLIDELEDFAMGKVSKSTEKRTNNHSRVVKERSNSKSGRHKEAEDVACNNQQMGADLESFFGMSSRSTSAPRSRAQSSESKLDAKVHNRAGPKASQRVSSGSSASVKKASLSTSFDELSSIFGAASVSGGFEEVEGESEERRRARLGRMQRTHERAARAVADMNQRDRQTQQEQEERRRIAETMDAEIKRWAAGKEGNMRALLSSLHYVLWPECGWEPVSLTNMITSSAVKKVYRKATLCVHPDKVQQKGASLQQKYIAEKIFDILKDAWTKFNKEELS